jgi:hypothetical protein
MAKLLPANNNNNNNTQYTPQASQSPDLDIIRRRIRRLRSSRSLTWILPLQIW